MAALVSTPDVTQGMCKHAQTVLPSSASRAERAGMCCQVPRCGQWLTRRCSAQPGSAERVPGQRTRLLILKHRGVCIHLLFIYVPARAAQWPEGGCCLERSLQKRVCYPEHCPGIAVGIEGMASSEMQQFLLKIAWTGQEVEALCSWQWEGVLAFCVKSLYMQSEM